MLPGNRLEHVLERLKQVLQRRTWNRVALILILVSLLLVATTMLSIDTTARSTADRLSLTSARNTLQRFGADKTPEGCSGLPLRMPGSCRRTASS